MTKKQNKNKNKKKKPHAKKRLELRSPSLRKSLTVAEDDQDDPDLYVIERVKPFPREDPRLQRAVGQMIQKAAEDDQRPLNQRER